MTSKGFSGAALTALLTTVPLAAEAQPEFFFGAGYGAYQIDENGLDEEDALWKAYFGSMFNSSVGIELSYVDFERASDQGSSFDADGYGIALLLGAPLSSNFTIYAKGGLYFWDAESNFAGVRATDDGDDPFYGAGLKFKLGQHLALRLEYERYKLSNIDLDTANLSIQGSF